MLGYVLTVFFACTSDCGEPAQFTAQTYQTYSQCVAAGGLWLSPNANPDQAVVTYQCNGTTVSVVPLSRHGILHLSHHQANLGQRPLLILRAVAGFRRRWSRHRFSRQPLLLLLLLYRRQDHQTRHRCLVLLAPRGEISSLQTTHLQLSHAEQGFVSQFCVF